MIAASEAYTSCDGHERSARKGAPSQDIIASTSQPDMQADNQHDCKAHAGKSHKRKAAEALLAARYTQDSSNSSCDMTRELFLQHYALESSHGLVHPPMPGHAADLFAQAPTRQKPTKVTPDMMTSVSSSSSSTPGVLIKGCEAGCNFSCGGAWCRFDVRIPHINWATVLDSNPATYSSVPVGKGYERYHMPENLQVHVVKNPTHAAAALQLLRASMQDPAVAIDLEWKPEYGPPKRTEAVGRSGKALNIGSKVAVMQLASATIAVVLHVAAMSFKLPPAVKAFLSDPAVILVGFGWDGSDERKMQGSFGFGRSAFGNFVDLQAVAQDLGYQKFGLSRIAKQVMGLTFLKAKKVTMSNWATHNLNMHQLKYASLDVLVAGQVFRGLRLWHSSPSPCSTCRQPVGTSTSLTLQCDACSAKFADITAFQQHCSLKGHNPGFALCQECGRPHQVLSAKQQAALQQQQAEVVQAYAELGVAVEERPAIQPSVVRKIRRKAKAGAVKA